MSKTMTRATLSTVVAANIRAEAARRGWTQAEMARRLDMTRPVINERYRERTPWTLDEMQKVADLFGVGVGDLVARPKGFEPLTFWLGADHTITVWGEEPYPDLCMGFCDDCGMTPDGVIVDPDGWAAWHARATHSGHDGERVERAS